MTVVALSAQARADLRDALEYRALYSDRAATSLADEVERAIARLTRFPQSGRPREDLGEGMRVLVLRSFRLSLFYHVLGGAESVQILLVRVLRHKRDVDADDIEAGL